MKQVKINFQNANNETLSGHLALPLHTEPQAYAIFAHCFTCNKNLNAVRHVSQALTAKGFGVLRFDFTGLGDSDGAFEDTNFSSNVNDLIAAANALTEQYEAPKLIVGHSLGGAASIFAANQIESIQAVATIGAPFSPAHVTHLFSKGLDEITSSGQANVDIGGRPFVIKKQFLDDICDTNMKQTLKELNKPILIMHSPQDSTVGVNNASDLYSHASHPKSYISLDGADHLLAKSQDSLYCGDVISSWATRYVDLVEPKKLATNNQVVVSLEEGFSCHVAAGNHRFRADEPASIGGNNFGPSPYELLLSSLGACTAMTLRLYANRKKIKLDEVIVHMDHNKKHLEDCENCESSSSKIDVIEKTLELKGDLTDEQKERMLQIADLCPVHKTLHNEVKVTTVLAE